MKLRDNIGFVIFGIGLVAGVFAIAFIARGSNAPAIVLIWFLGGVLALTGLQLFPPRVSRPNPRRYNGPKLFFVLALQIAAALVALLGAYEIISRGSLAAGIVELMIGVVVGFAAFFVMEGPYRTRMRR